MASLLAGLVHCVMRQPVSLVQCLYLLKFEIGSKRTLPRVFYNNC